MEVQEVTRKDLLSLGISLYQVQNITRSVLKIKRGRVNYYNINDVITSCVERMTKKGTRKKTKNLLYNVYCSLNNIKGGNPQEIIGTSNAMLYQLDKKIQEIDKVLDFVESKKRSRSDLNTKEMRDKFRVETEKTLAVIRGLN